MAWGGQPGMTGQTAAHMRGPIDGPGRRQRTSAADVDPDPDDFLDDGSGSAAAVSPKPIPRSTTDSRNGLTISIPRCHTRRLEKHDRGTV